MAKSKSDLSRAFSEDGERKTHVGGQALIEGVMMRGKYNWAVGVREPDGNIYEEEHDLKFGRKKNSWLNWPVVRGCRALVESLVLGYKALEIAATHAYAEEDEEDSTSKAEKQEGASAKQENAECSDTPIELEDNGQFDVSSEFANMPDDQFDDIEGPQAEDSQSERSWPDTSQTEEPRPFSWKDDFGNPDTMIDALGAQRTLEVVTEPEPEPEPEPTPKKKEKHQDEKSEFGSTEMAISMVIGVALALVLFIVVPAFVTNLIVGEYDSNFILWNIVDGLLRVAVFVFYLWLIGRMKDIKRMFAYHGAEHKTIHCYEHGLPLTPENARTFPRLHVRCGTAFLIMVLIIAIIVYSIVPVNAIIAAWGVPDGALKLLLVICVRIVFAPIIAGIAYEITVKWAGNHPNNPVVKVVLWPGMQMQHLTTNEPDDSMLECAISAMQQVLDCETAIDAAGGEKANPSSVEPADEPNSAPATGPAAASAVPVK